MRQSLKIALSLLIAIALFSGFAVLAFSGLFNVLEADFFAPRIEEEFASELASISAKIEKYHGLAVERFQARVDKDYVASAFAAVPPRDDAAKRNADFGSLQKDLPNLLRVRLLDPDGRRLHFSTGKDDVQRQLTDGIEYKTLDQADGAQSIPGSTLASADGGNAKVFVDGANDRFIYSLPVYQTSSGAKIFKGTALFYVASSDLLTYLLRTPKTAVSNIVLVGNDVTLVNFPDVQPEAARLLEEGINSVLAGNAGQDGFSAPLVFSGADGSAEKFRMFGRRLSVGGYAAFLAGSSEFEMGQVMKGLLLASVFFTVFLIVYIIFNLRPDPLEVVAQRVKRFQVQLLEQLIERNGGPDWGKWKGELEARRGEITRQIKRGLGRISRKQKPALDDFISKSWGEIIDILGRRSETTPAQAGSLPVDISRLEALIQQALKNAQFVIPPQGTEARKTFIEEIRAEEVEEPEEIEEVEEISGAEPAPEAEKVEEAEEVEEVEEIETLEEAEELPAAEGAIPTEEPPEEEAAEAEELEELAEAEEPPQAEEAGEIEEIEEAEEIAEAVEEEEAAEIAEVFEAGEAEEIQELEGVEELPQAEPVAAMPADSGNGKGIESARVPLQAQAEKRRPEGKRGLLQRAASIGQMAGKLNELVEVRIPSMAAGGSAVELEFPEALNPVLETSEEILEELEPLKEMQPLPPIPMEEGLEFLPMADEKAPERIPDREGWSLIGDHELESEARTETEKAEALEELEAVEPEEPEEAASEPEAEGAGEGSAGAEEAGTADAAKEYEERRREIEQLIANGGITVVTMERMQEIVDETKAAIVMEDGVFRIKEDIYQMSDTAKQGKLKELAEDVLRHERGEEPVLESESANGFSGIGDLIGEEEAIDLAKLAGVERDTVSEESLNLDREKSWTVHFKKNGVDYDDFLSNYPRSFTHTSQMKSLVEVSRRVSAVGAGLLLKKSDGFIPDIAVGANEKTLSSFRFPAHHAFYTRLSQRSAYVFNRSISEIRFIKGKIDDEDIRYMKRLLFIPAIFRSQDAYLYFLFSSDIEVHLEAVFSSLQVQ